ncbi:MAG TPA: response regulator [bacterium]|nr:response regulator [bacterium]
MNNKYKILIVEDDKDIAKGVAEFLRIKGYETFLAVNGKEGVELAKQIKPNLILLDIQMPYLNGKEALELLKNDPSTYRIPVIMVTSLSDTEDLKESFKIGAADYVIKPFLMDRLESKIKDYLK